MSKAVRSLPDNSTHTERLGYIVVSCVRVIWKGIVDYLELPYDGLQQRPRLVKLNAADVAVAYAHVGKCVPAA